MLDIQIQRGVALIRLDHGKANVLDLPLCRALGEVLRHPPEGSRTVVLTGSGSCFCAGVDLVRILEGGPAHAAAFLPALIELFEAALAFPGPLIAAINGHAIAGGCVIASAADLRLMADGPGRIGMAELAVGVPLPASAIAAVQWAARNDRLQEILYRATNWSPAEALDRGLVDEIVAADVLESAAMERAVTLDRIPREAFDLTKRHLRRPLLRRLASEEARTHDDAVLAAWQSEPIRQSIDAFVTRMRKG